MGELADAMKMSFACLGLTVVIGYVLLIVLRERKLRREERERKQREMEQELEKELGVAETESLADLEKKYGERGK